MKQMFEKILIANRGEIACRIIHACRELGVQSAVIYSEADTRALHVLMADEAVCVGPPAPLESYLAMDKIIAAAKEIGCDAIHPGYGFLAENHRFAQLCADEGLVFIGSHPDSIRVMGNKVEARQMMIEAGVPVIPGMQVSADDVSLFKKEAEKVGYPVLLKAAAGGGGKGMRVVNKPDDLGDALEGAQREAKSAFGDDSVYLEKFIESPRHIEFQVFGDHHGNAVHLFERECSIQRRHQKIIEETPSVALTSELRRRMGEAAIKVVKACRYSNAGTVEFLLDKGGDFYFLEMNTRIQVEHPITELVVGVDLVVEQIRVAAGQELSFRQDSLSQSGHAIECRIYAEDAANNFLPAAGKIEYLKEPTGPGIRVDSGIYSGDEVSVFYDPILSKLIVWGPDRESARKRMIKALSEYVILGVTTQTDYLRDVLRHDEFLQGRTYTNFIPTHMPDWKPADPGDDELRLILAGAAFADQLSSTSVAVSGDGEAVMPTPWQTVGKWEIGAGS
jgi:acetyl-CoA carboxylase biotin carboxylase subunit